MIGVLQFTGVIKPNYKLKITTRVMDLITKPIFKVLNSSFLEPSITWYLHASWIGDIDPNFVDFDGVNWQEPIRFTKNKQHHCFPNALINPEINATIVISHNHEMVQRFSAGLFVNL